LELDFVVALAMYPRLEPLRDDAVSEHSLTALAVFEAVHAGRRQSDVTGCSESGLF
jgi:hypothetical protein